MPLVEISYWGFGEQGYLYSALHQLIFIPTSPLGHQSPFLSKPSTFAWKWDDCLLTSTSSLEWLIAVSPKLRLHVKTPSAQTLGTGVLATCVRVRVRVCARTHARASACVFIGSPNQGIAPIGLRTWLIDIQSSADLLPLRFYFPGYPWQVNTIPNYDFLQWTAGWWIR